MLYHLNQNGKLMKNKQVNLIFFCKYVRVYSCLCFIGLEYLHSKKLFRRDIKPENLVCDDKGYFSITDFCIAQKISQCNEKDSSGTLGYMVPEVIYGQKQGFYSDYFALGVISYELMFGKKPYRGKT